MVRDYYSEPSEETKQILAARGDTWRIVPEPGVIQADGSHTEWRTIRDPSGAYVDVLVTVPPAVPDVLYQTPGAGVEQMPDSFPVPEGGGVPDAFIYRPDIVAATDAYYAAIQAGDLAGAHAAQDTINRYRRSIGIPDFEAALTDAQIVANYYVKQGTTDPWSSQGSAQVLPDGRVVYPGQPGYTGPLVVVPTTTVPSATVTPVNATAPPAGPGAPAALDPMTDTTGGQYGTPPDNDVPGPADGAAVTTGQTATVPEQMLARYGLNAATALSADEWDWYWEDMTGRTAPPPESYGFTGARRNLDVTIADWWPAFQAAITAPAGNGSGSGSGSGSAGSGSGKGLLLLAALGLGVLLWARR